MRFDFNMKHGQAYQETHQSYQKPISQDDIGNRPAWTIVRQQRGKQKTNLDRQTSSIRRSRLELVAWSLGPMDSTPGTSWIWRSAAFLRLVTPSDQVLYQLTRL